MKRAIVILSLCFVILGCDPTTHKSTAELQQLISENLKSVPNDSPSAISSIKVLRVAQKYPDSFRSPEDIGTTYVLETEVTYADGSLHNQKIRAGFSKADGWRGFE
jgi:hypothetical protein